MKNPQPCLKYLNTQPMWYQVWLQTHSWPKKKQTKIGKMFCLKSVSDQCAFTLDRISLSSAFWIFWENSWPWEAMLAKPHNLHHGPISERKVLCISFIWYLLVLCLTLGLVTNGLWKVGYLYCNGKIIVIFPAELYSRSNLILSSQISSDILMNLKKDQAQVHWDTWAWSFLPAHIELVWA